MRILLLIIFNIIACLAISASELSAAVGEYGCGGAFLSHGTGRVLHYRSDVKVKPGPLGTDKAWEDLVNTFRTWIGAKNRGDAQKNNLWSNNFSEKQELEFENGDVKINSYRGEFTDTHPEFWSMRYRHGDSAVVGRHWQTDVGITREVSGLLRVTLRTEYWLGKEFLGPMPNPPMRTTPRPFLNILTNSNWNVYSGNRLAIQLGVVTVKSC